MLRLLIFLLLLVFFLPEGNTQGRESYRPANNRQRNRTAGFLLANQLDSIKVNTDFSVMSPFLSYHLEEIEQLLIITSAYDQLFEFSKKGGKLSKEYGDQRVTLREECFNPDLLSTALQDYLTTNKNAIQQQIEQADLQPVAKEFLNLWLLYQLLSFDYCDRALENELVDSARSFMEKNPKSQFYRAVRDYFSLKYYPTRLGAGGYLQTGGLFPTGNLTSYLPNGIPINAGLSCNYGRVYVFAGFGPGIGGPLKRSIYSEKLWNEGDNITYSMGEVFWGINVVNTKKIGITPIIGIHGAALTPSSRADETYYDDVEGVTPYSAFAYGVNIDYKWGYSNCYTKSLYERGAGNDQFHWVARLTLGYGNPQYERNVPGMEGGLIFVKFGIAHQHWFKSRFKDKSWVRKPVDS